MTDYAVMPKVDYVAVCDSVREKTGDTEVIKSGELTSKLNDVYNAGAVALLQNSKYMHPTVSGEVIRIDDMADVPHKATITKKSDTVENLEAVKVKKFGKNLLDISTIPILNPNPSDMKNIVVDVETGIFSFEVTITNYSNGLTINAYLPIGTYFLSGRVHTASGLKCGVYIRKPGGSVYLNYAGTGFPINPIVIDTEGIWKFTFYRPYNAPVGDVVTYSNVQLEVGETRTEYQLYKASVEVGETFDSTPNPITLMPDTSGVVLDCQYCRDIDKYIDSLNVAVAMTGGV